MLDLERFGDWLTEQNVCRLHAFPAAVPVACAVSTAKVYIEGTALVFTTLHFANVKPTYT